MTDDSRALLALLRELPPGTERTADACARVMGWSTSHTKYVFRILSERGFVTHRPTNRGIGGGSGGGAHLYQLVIR